MEGQVVRGEKPLQAGGQGPGVGAEESQPARNNEGGGSADWARKERPLGSEPFAKGLQERGAGLTAPSSHPSLLPGSAGGGGLNPPGDLGTLSPGTRGPACVVPAGSSTRPRWGASPFP